MAGKYTGFRLFVRFKSVLAKIAALDMSTENASMYQKHHAQIINAQNLENTSKTIDTMQSSLAKKVAAKKTVIHNYFYHNVRIV